MNEINAVKFRDVYAAKIVEAITRSPGEYFYGPDKASEVAAKMTASLAVGGANLGPASKAAARALGVKPTLRDIKAYLNAPTPEAECAVACRMDGSFTCELPQGHKGHHKSGQWGFGPYG